MKTSLCAFSLEKKVKQSVYTLVNNVLNLKIDTFDEITKKDLDSMREAA